MFTLRILVLLSTLIYHSLQAVTLTFASSSPSNSHFKGNRGVYNQNPSQHFYLFTYYSIPVFPQPGPYSYFTKAYKPDGTELGSIANSGPNPEDVVLTATDRFVILPKTNAKYLFGIQSVTTSAVGFVQLGYSGNSHSLQFSSSVADSSTTYVYSGYFEDGALYLLSLGITKITRVDSTNLAAAPLSQTLYTSKFCNSLNWGPSGVLLAVLSGTLEFVEKTALTSIKKFDDINLGFSLAVDDSYPNIAYVGSKLLAANFVGKVDLSSTTFSFLGQAIYGTTMYSSNLVKSKMFRVVIAHASLFPQLVGIIDIDNMVVTDQILLDIEPSPFSFTLGIFASRTHPIGMIDKTNNRFSIYNAVFDYCATSNQHPCTSCLAGRYLDSTTDPNNNCLKTSEFPPQYGINGNTISPCLSGCLSCTNNYIACTACDNANGFYLDPLDSKCYTVNTMPDSRGLDIPSNLVAACSTQYCLKCAADRTVCTSCQASYNLYSNVCFQCPVGMLFQPSNSQCVANTVDGYGATPTSNYKIVGQCEVASCRLCRNDTSACVSCYDPYLYNSANSSCVLNTIDGFGATPDSNFTLMGQCATANCRVCRNDTSACVSCYDPYLYDPTNSSCILNSVDGYGATPGSNYTLLGQCEKPNCKLCRNDTSTCVSCNSPYLYYSVNDSCVYNNQDGYGATPESNFTLMGQCKTSNCRLCRNDTRSCVSCYSPYLYYAINDSCILNNVDGYGAVPFSNFTIIAQCETPNCKICRNDTRACLGCEAPYYSNPSTSSCTLNNVEGYGIDKSSLYNALGKCRTTSCSDCFLDSATCEACIGSEYSLINDTCTKLLYNRLILVNSPYKYDQIYQKFYFTFNAEIEGVANIDTRLKWTLRKEEDNTLINTDSITIKFTQISKTTFAGTLSTSSPISIEPSRLEISSKNTTDVVFRNVTHKFYPSDTIPVNGVAVSSLSNTAIIFADIASTVFKTTTFFGLASFQTSGGGSKGIMTLIRIIDAVDFTHYLAGIRVIKADNFVHLLDTNVLEIFRNIFETEDSLLRCVPGENFARESVSCSFLNNEGSEMITIMIFVAFFLAVLTFDLISKLIKKLYFKKIGTLLDILLWLPKRLFTASLVVTLIEGSQIEMFRNAALSLANYNATVGMLYSNLASVGILMLYTFYGWMLLTYIGRLQTKNNVKSNQISSNLEPQINLKSNSKKVVRDQLTLKAGGTKGIINQIAVKKDEEKSSKENNAAKDKSMVSLEAIVGVTFEDFRKPRSVDSKVYLCFPIFIMIKNLLSQTAIVVCYPSWKTQLTIMLLCEVSYILLIIILKPFESKYKQVFEISTASTIALILIANMALDFQGESISFLDRETYYGYTLIGLYSLAILMGVIPVVIDTVFSVFIAFKAVKSFCQSKESLKSKKRVAPRLDSEVPSVQLNLSTKNVTIPRSSLSPGKMSLHSNLQKFLFSGGEEAKLKKDNESLKFRLQSTKEEKFGNDVKNSSRSPVDSPEVTELSGPLSALGSPDRTGLRKPRASARFLSPIKSSRFKSRGSVSLQKTPLQIRPIRTYHNTIVNKTYSQRTPLHNKAQKEVNAVMKNPFFTVLPPENQNEEQRLIQKS